MLNYPWFSTISFMFLGSFHPFLYFQFFYFRKIENLQVFNCFSCFWSFFPFFFCEFLIAILSVFFSFYVSWKRKISLSGWFFGNFYGFVSVKCHLSSFFIILFIKWEKLTHFENFFHHFTLIFQVFLIRKMALRTIFSFFTFQNWNIDIFWAEKWHFWVIYFNFYNFWSDIFLHLKFFSLYFGFWSWKSDIFEWFSRLFTP